MEIKQIKLNLVNVYLLIDGENSILIDAGNSNERNQILEAIAGHKPQLLILTHGHLDHIGSALRVVEYLHIPTAMASEDIELITNPSSRQLYGHTTLGKMLAKSARSNSKNIKNDVFVPDIILHDGDSLEQYGIQAKIVALPGHTKGSIGIVFADNLIAGDAFFNVLKPTVARIYEDRQAMEDSVQKIKDLGIKMIYPGHGKPFKLQDLKEK